MRLKREGKGEILAHPWGEEGFPGGASGKESACNAGDASLITGLGRSPGGGYGNSSILAWRIAWTEEPGGLQSMGLQRVRHDFHLGRGMNDKVNHRGNVGTLSIKGSKNFARKRGLK